MTDGTRPLPPARVSGPAWVREFPTSRSTDGLASPFREQVERFLAALAAAGITVVIEAGFRPPERAHLMHFAFRIAREDFDPRQVPVQGNIPIDWAHRRADGSADLPRAFAAAQAMVEAYEIVYRPALHSVHCEARAIDLTLDWAGDIVVRDAANHAIPVQGGPRNCNHPGLHAIGATYGVIKLVRDTPHWSADGR
ncbi:MAG: peptidoglycan-binding domain-containing protein [Planctomycetota bacterium]